MLPGAVHDEVGVAVVVRVAGRVRFLSAVLSRHIVASSGTPGGARAVFTCERYIQSFQ